MSDLQTILVLEDEESLREMLELSLKKAGYKVKMCSKLKEALSVLERGGIHLVLTDVKLPDGSGIDMIAHSKTVPERPPVLLMTAFGSTDTAVEAMKLGAYHYLTKPFKLEELHVLVKRAIEDKVLHEEHNVLTKELKKGFSVESMLGESKAMKEILVLIERVTKTKANVLITGESGTGKELVARAIHYSGPLKSKPFVTVNCGAIPENLMESEMFGHKKGSFTGAVVDKEGLFQVADGGSIFLDEVGELPLSIQVKLLRVLQDRSFRAVGGTDNIKVDVRVITATNRNLEEMVAKGEFREDLFYRLNVINIQTPPLRNRKEDIAMLAEHFLRKFSVGMGKSITKISEPAMKALKNYNFPGNIRELQNVLERAVALEGHSEITIDNLPINIQKAVKGSTAVAASESSSTATPANDKNLLAEGTVNLDEIVGTIEKKYMLQALEKTKGVKKDAAKVLGITLRSFRYRMAKYGLAQDEDTDEGDES